MIRRLWMGLMAMAVLTGCCQKVSAQFGDLFRRGPKVEIISTTDLASLLDRQQKIIKTARDAGQQPKPADFVLVDVRSDNETNVSIIPGAITKAQYEKNRSTYKGRTVIAYCTVGGRSGAYAKQLAKSDIKVKNYQGSILEWVKNELPLVTRQGKPTNRVHTYSDQYSVPASYQRVTD